MLANALETLGTLLMSLLAVIGGALAGAVLTSVIVWLVCKYTTKQQPPLVARKLFRWLGGIAGALAVASVLSFGLGGTGGWGLFGGSGSDGSSQGAKTSASARQTDITKATQPEKKPEVSPPVHEQRVRIVVLGGPRAMAFRQP